MMGRREDKGAPWEPTWDYSGSVRCVRACLRAVLVEFATVSPR